MAMLTMTSAQVFGGTRLRVVIKEPIGFRVRTRIGLLLLALGSRVLGAASIVVERASK